MGQFSKSFEELEFSDNYMFCVVMKDIEVCKKFIEILLSIEIDTIEYVETEYPLDVIYNSKGIRMDVFVKNSTTVYDIEMQTSNYSDLIMRARYYLSATDINLTPKNTNYSKLYETYIMFICKKDPFNLKLPIYTEKKVFLEKPDHNINDKSTIIFYNTSEWEKVENQELKCLLKYIYTNKADSPFTKKLDTLVKQIKELQHLRSDYMYFSEIIEEEKADAFHAGIKEGIKEGEIKGEKKGFSNGSLGKLIELITKKLAKNKSVEQIADELEETPENIRKLIASMA